MKSISAYFAATACSVTCAHTANAQAWPSDTESRKRKSRAGSKSGSTDLSSYGDEGCAGLDASGFGSIDELSQNILTSSGNSIVDRLLYEETRLLNLTFQAVPAFGFLGGNSSTNAFATNANLISTSGQGTVVFGIDLIRNDWNQKGTAIAGIMAHEWAHIKQFQLLGNTASTIATPKKELHADFLAGWYLAAKHSNLISDFDISEFARSLYDKGDFDFNSPHHHGTPRQREVAMALGLSFYLSNRFADITSVFHHTRRQFGY